MTTPITAIIVDDEEHARQSLQKALSAYTQIQILAECEHGPAAIKAIHDLQPQLMFLDIQMPALDGFDVLELLDKEAPLTVFVTAYDEYAIRAFDNNALDYLLKPLDPRRLEKTIKRIEERLESSSAAPVNTLLKNHQHQQAPLSRILVKEKGDVHIIPSNKIIYIETAGDYVAIHEADKTHIKQERLQNLEKLLDASIFCRIHRSCLLNINHLAEVETISKDCKVAVLKDGKQLPISRSGYSRLKQML